MQLSEFQLSFYKNSTHVSVTKLRFAGWAVPYLEKAIKDILDKVTEVAGSGKKLGGPIETRVPWTVYPTLMEGMKKYNRGRTTHYMCLYYKHDMIGVIIEDIPQTSLVCQCGKKLVRSQASPVYSWWQKLVRVIFRSAYEPLFPETFLICPEHGKAEPITQTI